MRWKAPYAMMLTPLAFLTPSFGELALIAIIALLLYGSDLPQVAKTWGRAYQDFRKNLNGIQRDLNDAIYADEKPRRLQYYPEYRDEAEEPAQAAVEHHSPVAEAAAAEAASLAASDAPVDGEQRDHGAA